MRGDFADFTDPDIALMVGYFDSLARENYSANIAPELFDGPPDEARDESGKWSNGSSHENISNNGNTIPYDVRPEKIGSMKINENIINTELKNFKKEYPGSKIQNIPITPELKKKVLEHYDFWKRQGDERELEKTKSILSANELPAPIVQFYGKGAVGIPDGFHRILAYVLSGHNSIPGYAIGVVPSPNQSEQYQSNISPELFDGPKDEPRDDSGKWTEGAGSAGKQNEGDEGDDEDEEPVKLPATRGEMIGAKRVGEKKDARVILEDGSPAPAHITSKMVSPNWTNVKVSLDPDVDVRVTGYDEKGRSVTVYRDDFHMRNAAVKFSRTHAGLIQKDQLYAQNQSNRKSDNHDTREAADCTWLMQEQGTRPGSDVNTKADKQAYGATTLRAEHVREQKDGVHLFFIGKKGVRQNHLIKNPELAKMLLERKATAHERGGKLFDTNYGKVKLYAKSLDEGKFTPKDWRTIKANSLAISEIQKVRKLPKNEKEYKLAVGKVAETVSNILGNKPVMALKAYIDPNVFTSWKVAANA